MLQVIQNRVLPQPVEPSLGAKNAIPINDEIIDALH